LKTRCLGAAGLVLSLAGTVDAQTVHELSAASSVRVETTEDGNVSMRARNARFVPYVVFDGEKHYARLATIATEVRTRTDAEGVDPASTVAITVDDLSGTEPKRLSLFTDPGSAGEVVGDKYSAVTMPGCCAGADVHRVRALETGRMLFRSTGPGPTGTSAWAEAPNAKPPTLRWAAFDGDVTDKDAEKGLLGRILYGGSEGALSVVELRAKSRNDDLALGLSHSAVLVWIDPKAKPSNGTPSSGEPGFPQSIWTVEGISDPARLSGFQLALILDRKRLVAIPISGDRLVVAKAKIAGAVTVAAAPP
jgi:hypothetical protein